MERPEVEEGGREQVDGPQTLSRRQGEGRGPLDTNLVSDRESPR